MVKKVLASTILCVMIMGFALLFTTSGDNIYNISHPPVNKHSALIKIKRGRVSCSAFVISDTIAVTAAHCVEYDKTTLDNIRKNLPNFKMQLKQLENCFPTLQCMKQKMQLINIIEKMKTIKADIFSVYNTYGEKIRIKIIAKYKNNNNRDYALLKGNFKNFLKMPIQKDFTIKKEDKLRACGFAGSKTPPICTDFIASNTSTFMYAGRGYFVPGMSGGMIVNKYGVAVGIISAMDGSFAIIDTLIGIFNFEYKRPKSK